MKPTAECIDHKFYLTTFVTVGLAFAGYAYSWRQAEADAHRKAQLDRVNEQLRSFYGPLHSIMESEERSFQAFLFDVRPDKPTFWIPIDPPTAEQKLQWRRWILEVTMPNYDAIYKIIEERADLIEEGGMPTELIDLQAHIAGYKPVIAAWKEKDFSRHYSFFTFPQSARIYVRTRFSELKARQEVLLGREE